MEKSRDFNRSEWNSKYIDDKMSRYEMVDDLIGQELLLNKDSVEIENIIGEPDWKEPDKNAWIYDVGIGGGFGFNLHYLDVTFVNGKVNNVQHRKVKD